MEIIGTKTTVVFGKVVEIKEGTGAMAGRVINVQLAGKVYNGEKDEDRTIDIAFWNNEDGAQMADRARKAIKEDSYLMVRCSVNNGKYSGQDFKFKGQYVLDTEGDQQTSVTLGYVNHKFDAAKGKMRYFIAVDTYADGVEKTELQGINFSKKKSAAAEKIFAKGDKGVKALLLGFAPTSNVVGDKEYKNIVVYGFELPPYDKQESAEQ